MRYFCRVAYDGTCYGGWQRQPNADSIQQQIEKAAATVLRCPITVTGAGRTDAGVHARAQGLHFDYDGDLDLYRFTGSMNALLPDDIALFNARAVAPSFHARYSALRRLYNYYLCTRKSPLMRNAWPVTFGIDWGKIMIQITELYGEHDFSAFCASGSGSATAICTVFATSIEQRPDCMVFSIEANRFVYKMVRSIVGTLIEIGRGKQPLTIEEILKSGDRSLVGTTAPSCGLVLENVVYTEEE